MDPKGQQDKVDYNDEVGYSEEVFVFDEDFIRNQVDQRGQASNQIRPLDLHANLGSRIVDQRMTGPLIQTHANSIHYHLDVVKVVQE